MKDPAAIGPDLSGGYPKVARTNKLSIRRHSWQSSNAHWRRHFTHGLQHIAVAPFSVFSQQRFSGVSVPPVPLYSAT